MRHFIPAATLLLTLTAALALAQTTPSTSAPAGGAKPTLYLIGDSTVNNHSNGALGCGDPLAKLLQALRASEPCNS